MLKLQSALNKSLDYTKQVHPRPRLLPSRRQRAAPGECRHSGARRSSRPRAVCGAAEHAARVTRPLQGAACEHYCNPKPAVISLVDLQAIYDGAMNDHLMVAYLVSLSRAQLALSRRLQAPQQQDRF